MKDSQKEIFKKLTLLFIIVFILIGCNDESTPLIPPTDEAIEINFPIGKKAIYARGDYAGDNQDSLTLKFLTIYSLQFDTVITKSNTKDYIGVVERYTPSYLPNDSSFSGTIREQYETGRILASVDEKWVLLQNSEVIEAFWIFMKRNSTLTDTTDYPNWLYSQFPVFPRTILPNTTYTVVRPGNNDNFLEVQKEIEVKDYILWSDIYNSIRGLYYSTEQTIKYDGDFTFNYSGIIDEKGIVLSRTILEDFVNGTVSNPNGVDTTSLHLITRRIVDFTNPDYTHELSWYADYVKENGLTFLKDEKLTK